VSLGRVRLFYLLPGGPTTTSQGVTDVSLERVHLHIAWGMRC
jgi:hypothetical protein